MAEISRDLRELYDSNFKRIPCLNKDGCDFHAEIMGHLEVIEALLRSNQIEMTDLRQGTAIILEAHGIPCDEIKGWDLNTFRENKKNVREEGIQRSRNSHEDVYNREIVAIEAKERKTIFRGKKENERTTRI